MTTMELAERHGTLTAAWEGFRREPAFGPAWLHPIRAQAFQRFLERGFPTTRDEDWRFTNVGPVAALPFQRAPLTVSRASIEPFLFAGPIAHEAVVVNGRFMPSSSTVGSLPSGLTVRTGAEALAALTPASEVRGHTFVDLNTAFFEDVVLIDVAPGAIVEAPLHVFCMAVAADAPVIVAPRLVVRVGEHAQVTFVESYGGEGAGVTLTTGVTDIHVGPGAVIDHVRLQCESASAFHLTSTFAHVGRAGTFRSHALTYGGRIARNDIVSVLEGEGAECTLNGLYIADGESLVDIHTTIDHAQPHCPSHEVYKGILGGRAKAVFNGKIIVRPDAQKTDAKQTNKALLLTDEAQVNTKPQLEIFADDVRCTHGAAIGQLDEDAMFYLRARGISVTDARNLLIHAFAGEVIDGINVPAVRERAMKLMEEKLALV